MLTRAQRRMRRSGAGASGVSWIQATLPDALPPCRGFDGIVTHFFLDCFRPDALHTVVRCLAEVAAPDATWLIADFSVPPSGWKRWRARTIHRLMYWFFRHTTRISAHEVTAPDQCLTECGFSRAGRNEYDWGLVRTDKWVRVAG